jgi:hypothetical protein
MYIGSIQLVHFMSETWASMEVGIHKEFCNQFPMDIKEQL